MKKASLVILGLFILTYSFGQEICDNAIDDDGDGLIDLNDDDCDCSGIVIDWATNMVPNHSFEEKSCCPAGVSDDACVDDWHNVGPGTSDYLNTCDYWTIGVGPDYPLPSPGEGYVGFWPGEAIGCCLLTPLLAGETYLFSAQFSLESFWIEEPEMILSIFGGNECITYADQATGCTSGAYWDQIVRDTVMLLIDDSWAELSFYFTPVADFYSLAFTPCLSGGYYYMDDVFIGQDMVDTVGSADIVELGSYCDEDLMLQASADTIGGTWQWYLDGEALLGEISPTVDVMTYGLGVYSVVYFMDGGCLRSNHIINLDVMTASFDFVNVCVGEDMNFINTSEYDGVGPPEWEWDFGDGETSIEENPIHIYTDPGTYIVSLIGIIESGCNDTVEVEVTVYPIPDPHFEFVVGSLSSEDGATGGCLSSIFQFNDLSMIADPGTIISWDWNFGDGTSAYEENPTHTYDASGTYTVTLTVETENGCLASVNLEIIITEALSLDFLFNEPTCFGFSDGSVTVNTIGGSGELIYEITNATDDLLNEDNSNTANTLGEGWYYIAVLDGTECFIIDSIYLDQPDEMDIEISLTHPLCFGFETGMADITDVINYTGSDAAISYIWNPNPGGNSGLGENITGSMGAGDYTVTINDENGCSKVFDFTITEPDEIFFAEFGFEHAFCRLHEYQSGNGVVFGAAAGGTPDYSYIWTNLDNLDNSINSTWGGLNPGNYELTATDANGCILTQTLFLDSLNPIAAFTVKSDQLNEDCQGTATIQVEFVNESENYANPNNPGADTTFFWNLDDPIAVWQVSHDVLETFDTSFAPQGSTYFVDVCLVALNKNGCTDTACKVITIYEPIAFEDVNIFTPNGDGINDEFTFEFRSASIAEFNCVIINRWGIIVHEINDINEGWDGTNQNGDPCTAGVYFYKYVAKADNETDIIGQGNVQIVLK